VRKTYKPDICSVMSITMGKLTTALGSIDESLK